MAPQFFKDVHSGLNSKFTSRALSRKMDQNDDKADSSMESLSDVQFPLSERPFHDSSTTSTGSLSKFFGANEAMGGKINISMKDYMLADSSLNDIEVPAVVHKSSQQQTDDDDDIQITDVREVVQEDEDPAAEEEAVTSKTSPAADQFDGDITSGDVMMEALYKSQKYTTFLKKNLEAVTAKVADKDVHINHHHKKIEQMKESFKKFKETLLALEQKSSELKTLRIQDNESILALKIEYKQISNSLNCSKSEINVLKRQIDQLKKIKLSSTYEIEKLNKDITTLQKRLDEKSGALSEQKIKTLNLEKSLENCRKGYDENIKNVMDSSTKFQEVLIKKLEESYKLLTGSFESTVSESLIPAVSKIETDMATKIEELGEMLLKSLDLSRTSLSTQLSHSLKETAESVIGLMEKQEVKDSENFNNINKSQHDANQGLNKIVDLVNKINAGITDKKLLTENFKDSLGLVEVRIEELDKAIRDQMGFSLKIEELTKQNKELESTISAHVQKIQDSESELARNLARTTDYEIKVEQLESKCIGYSTEISQLKSMLLTTETNLKSAEDKTLKCKITCDSKLQTQQDIFKIVSQERDHFELELEKHRKSSTQLIEVQTSQIEKLQKENSKLVKEVEQKGKLQNEEHKKLMDTKKENADLKQEIKELQTKSTIKVTKHKISNRESCDLDQNDSMIDVPISFKSSVATGSKAPAPSSTITKKSKVQLGKRKKLLDDDHDDISLFGNFDFDSAIENQFPSLPRRYTKKKKKN